MPLLTEVNSSNDFGRFFAKTVETNPPIPVCTPLYKVILSSFLLRGSLFLCPLKLGHFAIYFVTYFDQQNAAGHCVTSKSRLPEVLQFLLSPSCCPLKNEKVRGEKDAADSQHEGSDKWGRRLWATQPIQWATEGCSHWNDHSQTSKRTTSLTLAQTANPQNY